MGRGKAEMPARQGRASLWGRQPSNGTSRRSSTSASSPGLLTVKHHASDLQLGIGITESPHEGAEGGSLTSGIQHQHHRQVQQAATSAVLPVVLLPMPSNSPILPPRG